MPTECSPDLFGFAPVESRRVEASFDAGLMTSDAGALLLGATDRAIGLIDRLAGSFVDRRKQELIEHAVPTLVGQRVVGIALGYEDLNDHDRLRHDPVLAVLAGKLAARRSDCAPVAGKSTLNWLELSTPEPTLYHKINYRPAAVEALFVDLFLEAHRAPPARIVLDLDATDDPLHGAQEGRFFHGYYDCYCYLPLYIFCGRQLLCAKLRRSNIDASAGVVEEVGRIVGQIRRRWPEVRILLRGDSGFAREALMAWCERQQVDFLFGLARNERLQAAVAEELAAARAEAEAKRRPARRYKDFEWSTRDSWSRRRRVIGKAAWSRGEANPRFVVTSLKPQEVRARRLYETLYCFRGEMEWFDRLTMRSDQGVPTRPVRRPHLGPQHAGQPAQALVRFVRLRIALRAAPDRLGPYPPRQGHLRAHSPGAAEDRRPGPHQRAPDQVRHAVGLPAAGRVPHRP